MSASKQFYHDIDLVKIGQLVNARLQNVTDAEMSALAATLGVANKGLVVYNTTQSAQYSWDGAVFKATSIELAGDLVFKGVVDASVTLDAVGGATPTPAQVEPVSGYQYVVGTAGTLTAAGVTFSPSAVAEVGDVFFFTSPTQAYVIQRNDAEATETVLGNVRLATQAEVSAGAQATEAVTPATLAGALVANKYVKQFFATVDIPAGITGINVIHGLKLKDPAAFQLNTVDAAGNVVSFEADAIDVDTLRLRSFTALTGVKVTVQGASDLYVGV